MLRFGSFRGALARLLVGALALGQCLGVPGGVAYAHAELVQTDPPGPYTLTWTSVSAEDGHQQSSFFGLIAGGQPLTLSDPVAGVPTSGPGDLGVNLAVVPDDVRVPFTFSASAAVAL